MTDRNSREEPGTAESTEVSVPDLPTVDARARPAGASPAAEVPARIGPYRILREIGRGGMGVVLLAEQEQPVRRRVAVKLVRTGLFSDDLQLRFRAEQQALARLNHPSVAQIYDAGTTPEGVSFFVMELVDGPPLVEYCRERRLRLEERLALFLEICAALQHAHRRGILHRDVKPSNVLVCEVGGRPLPKVIDFGLAKPFGTELVDDPVRTRLGSLVGTPVYMSPEQASGREIDTRSDVYALGAVLYELLAGEPPFGVERLSGKSHDDLVRILTEEEPERPSRRLASRLASGEEDPGEQRRGRAGSTRGPFRAPASDLDWIVLKAIAKDPDRRYGSPEELASDLRRFLAGQPVVARRPTLAYRAGKYAHRHRYRLAAVAAALVGILLALGWGLLRTRREAERGRVAQAFGQRVERIQALARYAHLSPLHDVTATYGRIRERMAEIEEEMRQLGGIATGPGHYALGRGGLVLDRVDEAVEHLETAWSSGYRTPDVAYALGLALGRHYRAALEEIESIQAPATRRRRLEEARTDLRDPAVRYLELGREAETEVPAYAAGLIELYEGRHEEALSRAEQARAEQPWLYEAQLLVGEARMQAGKELKQEGRFEQALAVYEAARRAGREAAAIGRSDPRIYERLCQIGMEVVLLHTEQLGGEVEAPFRLAAADCALGLEVLPGHVEVRTTLAKLHRDLGEHLFANGADPRRAWGETVRLAREATELSPGDPGPLHQLGVGLYLQARYEGGTGGDPRALFAASVEALERALELAPGDVTILTGLGVAWGYRGEWEKHGGLDPRVSFQASNGALERAARLEREHAFIHVNLGVSSNELGDYLARRGLPGAAEALAGANRSYEETLRVQPRHRNAMSNMAYNSWLYGRFERRHGRDPSPLLEKAREMALAALRIDPDFHSAHHHLGEVHRELAELVLARGGDPLPHLAQARSRLRRSVAINGANAARHYLAAILVELVEARYLLARGERAAGPLGEARRLLDEALRFHEGQAGLHLRLGQTAFLEGREILARGGRPEERFAAALDELERALEVQRDLLEAAETAVELHLLWTRHRVERGSGDEATFERGREWVERARAINPSLPRLQALEGALLIAGSLTTSDPELRSSRSAQGQALLGEALRRNPFLRSELEEYRELSASSSSLPITTRG